MVWRRKVGVTVRIIALIRLVRGPIGPRLLDHLIFKSHAFRVVFAEPPLRGFLVSKHLQVLFVADLSAGIDVNQERFSLVPL